VLSAFLTSNTGDENADVHSQMMPCCSMSMHCFLISSLSELGSGAVASGELGSGAVASGELDDRGSSSL
jgi:hypothetical protein